MSSAEASVGSDATVTITLADVELPGQTGYAFDLTWDESRLSMPPELDKANTCGDGQIGFYSEPGKNPYSAACGNAPRPGKPRADCSPGPCVLARLVFTCTAPGVAALNLSSGTNAAFLDASNVWETSHTEIRLPSVMDGSITCT